MNAADDTAQNEWMGSLLGDFLDESGQLLERLNENLLQLDVEVRAAGAEDAACDQNRLNEMFRAAHSLKGLSAMLGLSDINHLTHRLENVFDAARREELAVTDDVVELMFRSVDQLEKLIELLKDPDAVSQDIRLSPFPARTLVGVVSAASAVLLVVVASQLMHASNNATAYSLGIVSASEDGAAVPVSSVE